jgi:MFS superfamily sulfate permease-like transporter
VATDVFTSLLLATTLGVLLALVLSLRRIMGLEIKQEKLLNTIKRVELRDIAMEERTYKILQELMEKKKPARKKTTKKR